VRLVGYLKIKLLLVSEFYNDDTYWFFVADTYHTGQLHKKFFSWPRQKQDWNKSYCRFYFTT